MEPAEGLIASLVDVIFYILQGAFLSGFKLID